MNASTGLISGTPTAAGRTLVTVGYVNEAGLGSASLAITVAGQPTLANITAQRRAGTKLVDITYDLDNPQGLSSTVTTEVSRDGGTTWLAAPLTLTGAVGANIVSGTGKLVTWNVGLDWPAQSFSQVKIRVTSNDGQYSGSSSTPADFRMIPAGTFTMGDSKNEGGLDARPTRPVTVGAFYLQSTETTYAQWKEIVDWNASGSRGYDFSAGQRGSTASGSALADTAANNTHPVTMVKWGDVVKWCNAKSRKDGLTPCYYTDVGFATELKTGTPTTVYVNWSANGYRLPTEAEWEYAARGGLAGKSYPGGDEITNGQANYSNGTLNGTTPVGYYNGSQTPAGVDMKNGYGLYDMAGNVGEWNWDWYGSYSFAAETDPRGPASATYRVFRGGSWNDTAPGSRISVRRNGSLADHGRDLGFRPARSTVAAANRIQSVSATFALQLVDPPAIATQLADQAVVPGQPVTFTLAATSTAPFTYQWRKDGVNIASATNASYTIASAPTTAAGSYDVVVTNVGGGTTSQPATLTVAPAMIFTTLASGFSGAAGIAVDSAGNVYEADSQLHTIRKITYGGTVTTLAGSAGSPGSTDGTGSAARFNGPRGVALDSADNVYVADFNGSTIRKITSTGVVTTLAGSAGSPGSADGTGTAARFSGPHGVTVDSAGNIYVADLGNATIRKITSGGVVTTLAGTAGVTGSADGTGAAAKFFNPAGIAMDGAGVLYVSDRDNHTIRKITSGGVVTTLAGLAGAAASVDGTGSAARFNVPYGIASDSAGNLYVADTNNHTVRKVTSAGVVTTIAGLAGTAGSADGTGSASRFNAPYGVAVDSVGNLYVSSYGNSTIRWGAMSVPALTSAATAIGIVGQSFSVQTTFSGVLAGPFTASGLPAGLTMNASNGLISGTPTAAGTTTVTVGSVNGAGSGSGSLAITVIAPPTLANIAAQQRTGSNLVDITYDLGHAQGLASTVTVEVSQDGGTTWLTSPLTLTGAVGANVIPGNGKVVTWNAGANWPAQNFAQVKVRLTADDGQSSTGPTPADLSLIPAGTFTMGDSLDGDTAAQPTHVVTLPAFFMAKTETMFAEWVAVRDWAVTHGYADLASIGAGKADTHPVQLVSWNNVVKWLNAKSEKDGLVPAYYTDDAQTTVFRTGSVNVTNTQVKWMASGYRLPTEAEWEYAARGGLTGKRYPLGDTITQTDANYGNHPTYATGATPYTSPAGAFAANGYGLQDMAGNVSEWCWDWTGSYGSAAVTAPLGPLTGDYRVFRGGGWDGVAGAMRSAIRASNRPGDPWFNVGFRQARSTIAVAHRVQSSSATFALQLNDLPTITTQPQSVAALVGQSTTFTVVAVGSGSLTFQWRKGTVAISGATNATYTIASAQLNDAGSYDVVVSNGVAPNATSTAATLTVTSPSTVSISVAGNAITTATGTVAINLASVGTENAVFFSLSWDPAVLTYASSALGTSVQSDLNLGGSNINTSQTATGKLGLSFFLKAGASVSAGTRQIFTVTFTRVSQVASTKIAFGNTPILREIYDIFGNYIPLFFSDVTISTLTPTTPAITAPPLSQTIAAGQSATFSVVASGTGPFTYQWRKGGVDIGGATSASYTIASAPTTSAGSYDVVVTNAGGSTTSSAATLSIVPLTVVAAGGGHALYRESDGTLWAMGANANGQLGDGTTIGRGSPVQLATGVASVAAGNAQTLFLKTDGTLWATGFNGSGQLGDGTTTSRSTPVQVASGVASVAAGNSHTLFINTDGTLWAMGSNSSGRLGDGTTTNRSTPVQVASGVATAAAGGSHSLFVKTDGTLWAMGINSSGQLGDGTTTSRSTPVQIASGVASAAAGNSHSLFVKTDGTLWAMGLNSSGQLGDGTTTSQSTPVQVATGVASAAAGSSHTVFVKTGGTLWAMGLNSSGQLGDGATINRSTPVQVATSVASAAAGTSHTLFVKTDGTRWAAGLTSFGALGDGTTIFLNAFAPVASGVSSVAPGSSHTLFVTTNGALWATGTNSSGQLGDGTTVSRSTAVQVASDVASVAVGSSHSMFVKTDGTLWAMGSNNSGQLGDGTTTSRLAPVQVASGVASVSAPVGSSQTLFVKTDGTLWAMGFNGTGQLGDGTTTSRSTPVQISSGVTSAAAGGSHSLFVKTDGTLWAMGSNSSGALGDGTTTLQSTPVQIVSGVAAASAGLGHTLFLKTDGTVWATGLNTSGQLGDGTTTNRITPVQVATGVASVAAGNTHTLFVKTNGLLWGTGSSSNGQLGDGAILTRSTPVPVGVAQTPVIAVQPAGRAVNVGQDVTLWVWATGGVPAPTYQWKKGTTAIAGATNATLTLTSVQSADAASYTVVVTTSVSSVTSAAAAVTVSVPPVITTPPTNRVADAGQPASFSVVATGTATLTYQWRKGTVAINGATNAIYTIASAQLTDAGNYDVVVTNSAGSVTSNAVTLTVNPALIATQAIASRALTAGTAAVAFAPVTAAGGTAPLAFSIAPALPGGLALNATTGAISGTPAAGLVATTFTVTVTDATTATASKTFSLTVNSALSTTQAIASTSLTTGTAAAAFTPVTAASGAIPYAFAVSPSLPAGLVLNATTGSISGTPTVGSAATTYTITVTDNAGAISSKTFSLTVAVLNTAPTLSTIATLTGAVEDSTYPITYAALAAAANEADTEGDALSFRVEAVSTGVLTKNGTAVVAGTTLLGAGESVVWTPAVNANGTLNAFTVKAWDGALASASAIQVKVTVASVNDAPVGTDKTITTPANTDYVFATADFGFTDPNDSPAHTLSAVKITTLPTAGTLAVTGVSALSTGAIVTAADIVGGKLKFTPVATASGSPYAIFTFQVMDDGGQGTGGIDLDPVPKTITVNVPPAGTLQFGAATYSVNENGANATVTVTRTGGSSGAVSVTYATGAGTAIAGLDYTAAIGTLSWASGDTASKTFTVSILDDALLEGSETVNLVLSNPTGGATLGTPATVILTIVDDEIPPAGTLQFSAATYSVNENGGSITVTVTRTGGSNGAIGVNYATGAGTAIAGLDYTAASGTLSWVGGDTASKTFTVTIVDDSIYEGNETVNLTLSNPTGGATLGSPTSGVLTIVDNEPAPAITTQPIGATIASGQTRALSVVATGAAPLTYQWYQGTSPSTAVPISGATSAAYTTPALTTTTSYWVRVTSGVGTADSATATVTVHQPPTITSAANATFMAGQSGSFTIVATGTTPLTFSVSAGSLPSWATLNAATGTIAGTPPSPTGSPFTFTLSVANDVSPAATQSFTLTVQGWHSADTSPADGFITLDELTRVIELYNTRNGSVRTGRYQVATTTTIDGFAVDAATPNGSSVTLSRYHSADTDRDGKLSLVELSRVIELYGYHVGTVRTGQYHISLSATEDGFAPGP